VIDYNLSFNLPGQVVLLSITAGDRQGLPSPERLAAVEGHTLLRTDENGWIHLSPEWEQMWVEVERGRGYIDFDKSRYYPIRCRHHTSTDA
jgi:hypothetical protein